MIRQAISCDICGSEKKQTNHWFVAYDQSGELRVSGWSSKNRLRPGVKHLCGQTCLHKLVDDFMARALAVRPHPCEAEEAEVKMCVAITDASLTSNAAYIDGELSARLMTQAEPVSPKAPPFRPQAEVVALPPIVRAEEPARALEEMPRYASRNWRAEAWERERERSLRSVDRRPGILARRRSGS